MRLGDASACSCRSCANDAGTTPYGLCTLDMNHKRGGRSFVEVMIAPAHVSSRCHDGDNEGVAQERPRPILRDRRPCGARARADRRDPQRSTSCRVGQPGDLDSEAHARGRDRQTELVHGPSTGDARWRRRPPPGLARTRRCKAHESESRARAVWLADQEEREPARWTKRHHIEIVGGREATGCGQLSRSSGRIEAAPTKCSTSSVSARISGRATILRGVGAPSREGRPSRRVTHARCLTRPRQRRTRNPAQLENGGSRRGGQALASVWRFIFPGAIAIVGCMRDPGHLWLGNRILYTCPLGGI